LIRRPPRRCLVALWLLAFVWIAALAASPARAQLTFPGASPVSAGNIVLREQPVLTSESGGFQGFNGQTIVLYGASPNLALITEGDLIASNMANVVSNGKTVRLAATGIGDTIQEARYTVLQIDGIGSTIRLAPLVGVTVPTGMDNANGQLPRDVQPGTGNWGARAALTASWQTLYWNAEAEVGYHAHAPGAGYLYGNSFVADAAYHYLLWPRDLGNDVPGEWYASLESNYSDTGYNRQYGRNVTGTGGQLWLLDPGIIYGEAVWGFALTALLPVQQTVTPYGSHYNYGLLATVRWSLFTTHHW